MDTYTITTCGTGTWSLPQKSQVGQGRGHFHNSHRWDRDMVTS